MVAMERPKSAMPTYNYNKTYGQMAVAAGVPVVVLLHGAFQGSESATMIDLATELARHGLPSVCMSRRGYGGMPLRGERL